MSSISLHKSRTLARPTARESGKAMRLECTLERGNLDVILGMDLSNEEEPLRSTTIGLSASCSTREPMHSAAIEGESQKNTTSELFTVSIVSLVTSSAPPSYSVNVPTRSISSRRFTSLMLKPALGNSSLIALPIGEVGPTIAMTRPLDSVIYFPIKMGAKCSR